jgi:hypothetical protein
MKDQTNVNSGSGIVMGVVVGLIFGRRSGGGRSHHRRRDYAAQALSRRMQPAGSPSLPSTFLSAILMMCPSLPHVRSTRCVVNILDASGLRLTGVDCHL